MKSFSIPANRKVVGFPSPQDVVISGGAASGSRVVFEFYTTEQINVGDNINNQSIPETLTAITASIGPNQANQLKIQDFVFKIPRQDDKKLWV